MTHQHGTEEHSAGVRGISTFPDHWGLPEGQRNSPEREAWVLRNVAEDSALKRRGLNPAEARAGQPPRRMSGAEALQRVTQAAREG